MTLLFPVVILTVGLAGAVIDWIIDRRLKAQPNVEQGFGRYPGSFLSYGIVIGLLALGFAALPVTRAESRPEWPIILPVAVLLLALSYYCIHKWLVTRWEWDAEGVTFISGNRVTRLPWADIAGGKWLIGGWRITGPNGPVSCWYSVVGYYALSDALIKHRPDLARVTHLRA